MGLEIANVKSPNPIIMIDQLKKRVTIKSYVLNFFQGSFGPQEDVHYCSPQQFSSGLIKCDYYTLSKIFQCKVVYHLLLAMFLDMWMDLLFFSFYKGNMIRVPLWGIPKKRGLTWDGLSISLYVLRMSITYGL